MRPATFWKVIRLLEKLQDKGMKGLQVVMDVGLTKKMTFMQNQDSELHRFKRHFLGREKSQPESPTQPWCCPSGSQMSSCGLFLSITANSRFSDFSSFVGSGMSNRIERKGKSVRPGRSRV